MKLFEKTVNGKSSTQAVRSHLLDLLDLCVIFTGRNFWIWLDLLIVLEQSSDLKFNTNQTLHWLSGLMLYTAEILLVNLVTSNSLSLSVVFLWLWMSYSMFLFVFCSTPLPSISWFQRLCKQTVPAASKYFLSILFHFHHETTYE